ncbi:DUF2946 family protein [Halioxenophilus sp. WMMB6]|uniref:DUF2946 family protein n=1 Tax=Halioxenophilus sp. WMMB6 TaxID=3073815 RepID=UPI00295EA629|nr:DUF2946 family protein [Halioxenophilus sp. WMMB6]
MPANTRRQQAHRLLIALLMTLCFVGAQMADAHHLASHAHAGEEADQGLCQLLHTPPALLPEAPRVTPLIVTPVEPGLRYQTPELLSDQFRPFAIRAPPISTHR